MALSDYSTTASSNGNVLTGIDIAENCLPSNLNNAQRQVMADLATDLARANGSQEGLATGVSFAMPRGSIIMWSNTAGGTVPVGWALCDGTNGTPNLANKFIRSEATEASGGGADSVTLAEANIPQHSHDSGTLTGSAASAGGHTHGYYDTQGNVVTGKAGNSGNAVTSVTDTYRTTITAGAHTHTVSITGGTTGSYGQASPTAIDNRPAYYALAFIMKL